MSIYDFWTVIWFWNIETIAIPTNYDLHGNPTSMSFTNRGYKKSMSSGFGYSSQCFALTSETEGKYKKTEG